MPLHYCKKCGRRIINITDPDTKNCDFCNSELYPVPQQYLKEECSDVFKDKETAKYFFEKYIKENSKFDQTLYAKCVSERRELRKEEWEITRKDMPNPPGAIDFLPIFLILFVFGLVCFILPSPFNIIGFLLFLITGICTGISNYNSAKKDYHLAQTDFEEYKRKMKREQEEIERQHELERQRKAIKNVSPKCPYCGSYHTSKIGVISRGISTEMFGLASGKIGKQWHCNHCGSDF